MHTYRFAFVSNSEAIARTVHDFAASRGLSLVIRLASMEEALPVAKELLDEGVDVILGGGGTGRLLRHSLKRPVITISRSHLDLLKALLQARSFTNHIAITSYGEVTEGLDVLADLLRIRLRPVLFNSSRELAEGIAAAVDDGVGCVVGGGVCADIAGGLGCRGIVVLPGARVIKRALEEAVNIARSGHRDKTQAAWLAGALESLHAGIIGVDGQGEIVLSNAWARQYLNAGPGNQRAVFEDFLKSADARKVLQTGKRIPDNIISCRGRSLAASVRPIRVDGAVQGALAAFRPAHFLRSMGSKLRRHDRDRGFAARHDFSDLAGSGPALRKALERAKTFARTDANIFIRGETGTGKELVAHALHKNSPRAQAPFVAVNCAALPDSLLESELFGYEEGAFTGARKGGKEGLFLLADTGTIFLDEVGDISPLMQVRLLRVLEAREIMQVGGGRIIPVDVRVVSSSWKDLAAEVRAGRFRADLYFRLTGLCLDLPPLRERLDDLPELARALLLREGKDPDILSEAGLAVLAAHPWPGNVRELASLLYRYALLLEAGGSTGPDEALLAELVRELSPGGGQETPESFEHAPDSPPEAGTEPAKSIGLKQQTDRFERAVIQKTLAACGGSRELAAKQLGISPNTLWRKMR